MQKRRVVHNTSLLLFQIIHPIVFEALASTPDPDLSLVVILSFTLSMLSRKCNLSILYNQARILARHQDNRSVFLSHYGSMQDLAKHSRILLQSHPSLAILNHPSLALRHY